MSWVAVGVAAVGAVGSVAASAMAPGASSPGQRNLGSELNGINDQYQNLLGQMTGGTGNFNQSTGGNLQALLGGSFNQSKAIDANNDLYNQFVAAKQSGELDQGWKFEDYARASGVDTQQYISGGLGEVSATLNTQNRAANLMDAANFAKPYSDLLHNTNPDYYNQVKTFTQAANAPVQQSGAQQQAAQQASQGFGTFDPSGLYANTNYSSQTINPLSVNSRNVTAATGNPVLDSLNQQALTQGPSDLQTKQNAIANQLLDQGGNLSESDLRNVQQSSRAGFAARGLDGTNASVVDEALQTDAARRARLVQNVGLAQGIQNQGLAESGQQQNFGLNVSNQNYGYNSMGLQAQTTNANNYQAAQTSNQGANLSAQTSNAANNLQAQNLGLQAQQSNQNFGLGSFNANVNSQVQQQQALQQAAALAEQQRQSQLSAMLAATQQQQAAAIDPYTAMLNGSQNNLGVLQGLYGTNANTNGNLLNSLLGYGGDLNNTNFNANAAANIAAGNNNAALTGSIIGGAAGIGSAYAGNRGGASQPTSGDSSHLFV